MQKWEEKCSCLQDTSHHYQVQRNINNIVYGTDETLNGVLCSDKYICFQEICVHIKVLKDMENLYCLPYSNAGVEKMWQSLVKYYKEEIKKI